MKNSKVRETGRRKGERKEGKFRKGERRNIKGGIKE